MVDKVGVSITVSYFKPGGKWYMDEKVEVPDEFVSRAITAKDMKDDAIKFGVGSDEQRDYVDFQSQLTFDFRNWFNDNASHKEFVAFVQVLDGRDDGTYLDYLLGYSSMILPKGEEN